MVNIILIFSILYHACRECGLIISLKKTNCIASIAIYGNSPEVVNIDLGSRISSSMSLDVDVNTTIGKAVVVMGRLSKRVWDNNHLTENIKLRLY